MNIKVIVFYLLWVLLCFSTHTVFGGFCGLSGFVEGLVGMGLASIFWTRDDQTRRNR
jgi:hypothetical protein